MKRFLKIALPIIILAILFSVIYILTRPQVTLPSNPEINAALSLLQNYGYESRQIVGASSPAHLMICFTGFVAACVLYFYFYDRHEKKKILKVLEYVRKINQRVYDLKLDENSEDELSLLTNELYKTTVLLQKAAENNRQRAHNLETALADISHQLRTPLTSLQIALDNLYENPDLDVATRQEFLKIAGREVEQMSELVITLLNLAKLDNGSLKMKHAEVSCADLLNGVSENLAVLSEIANVPIEISGDLNARIKIDQRWQTEALTNIVKNCIEHSSGGQAVKIAVRRTAVFTKIEITDSGDGISPEDARHIFERFYKAKNALEGNVGIGLAFAKTLIEADGGQVRASSGKV